MNMSIIFKRITPIFEYILLLLLVLGCQTPYQYAIENNYRITFLSLVMIMIVLVLYVLSGQMKKKAIKNFSIWFLFYFLYIIIFILVSVNMEDIFNFVARFLIILPVCALFFLNYIIRKDPYHLIFQFINIIALLSLLSLIFWTFGSMLNVISPTGYFSAFWGKPFDYINYYGVYFERQQITIFGLNIIRNGGIFCEAPMFSLCLTLALASHYLFRKKTLNYTHKMKKKYLFWSKLIILIVAQITTFSTSGLIIISVLFVLHFLFKSERKSKNRQILRILFGSIIILCTAYIGQQLLLEKMGTNSWLVRIDDIRVGIKSWTDSPIWGNGYLDNENLKTYMNNSIRSNYGYSNSLFLVLSQGGLVLLGIYLSSFSSLLIASIKNKKTDLALFCIVFIGEFIITLWQDTLLIMFFLSFGMSFMMIKRLDY